MSLLDPLPKVIFAQFFPIFFLGRDGTFLTIHNQTSKNESKHDLGFSEKYFTSTIKLFP